MSGDYALTTVSVTREQDVVVARQRARQIARLLGFDDLDQVRVATATSELARNVLEHGGGGEVAYAVKVRASPEFSIRVTDRGVGIADLAAILEGRFTSRTGMGIGIIGARRLVDSFDIQSAPGAGTTVTIAKRLPNARPLGSDRIAELARSLASESVGDPLDEIQHQNRELMQALAELQAQRDEVVQLNRELEETNRGVVALYAELDERAEDLRRSSDTKSRFLSSLSHELRTPLTSMLALSELLLNRIDGPLTDEQDHQVRFIFAAADGLLALVNDLLDLARVEAGKAAVRPTEFDAASLFGALRGMFRPLHTIDEVSLVFDSPDGLPPLFTDEAKVAQILRNLISNALKFTERGEVRMSAALEAGGETVVFTVSDTGIGISPEDRLRIFDEFVQIDSALQAGARGAGLGLAVCQRLAAVLGGQLDVESEAGSGSTFSLAIPRIYIPDEEPPTEREDAPPLEAEGVGKVALIIDDDDVARYLAGRTLRTLGFEVEEASGGLSGLERARQRRPDVIVLDLKMPELDGFVVLQELKMDFRTSNIPVVVQTAKPVSARERSLLNTAVAIVDKREAGQGLLANVIQGLARA